MATATARAAFPSCKVLRASLSVVRASSTPASTPATTLVTSPCSSRMPPRAERTLRMVATVSVVCRLMLSVDSTA